MAVFKIFNHTFLGLLVGREVISIGFIEDIYDDSFFL